MPSLLLLVLILVGGPTLNGFGASSPAESVPAKPPWPRFELQADRWWPLNLPDGKRLDASALLQFPSGELWTVNDQSPGVFRILLSEGAEALDLARIPDLLTTEQVSTLLQSRRPGLRLDCEGLARDDQGRIYLCEEDRRWILRWDPESKSLEKLAIDWSPVARFFHPTDRNASFEGIAVAGNRLFVANERQVGRIIVIDLASLKVIDDFSVTPSPNTEDDTHFTDLCAFKASLWALLRDTRKVLELDPVSHQILKEFDHAQLEMRKEVAFGSFFAPGFMEGLAVDDRHLWLLTDNNGWGRRVRGSDTRPILFRCPRPDLAPTR